MQANQTATKAIEYEWINIEIVEYYDLNRC